jgi:hypothetical protein
MNKTYILKRDAQITKHILLKKGQEIEVVNEVVYMSGFPVTLDVQKTILDWIKNNPTALINDTRHF